MALDVFTLFICELFVLFFLIIIMAFAWCGSQYNRVIGFQCLSLIITLVFVSLSSLRSSGLMFLPILVGNTLVMLAYGLTFTLLAMVNERTQIQYKHASLRDPLTGIWNRRALFEKAKALAASCNKSAQPLYVMLFDLDHFKSINDRFGHAQGDLVLIDFCQQVEQHLPFQGYFARLGGEEFAAVVVGSASETVRCAESIRQAVERASPDNVRYTVSVGVAASTSRPHLIPALMAAADEALYHSKALGRNRVSRFIAPTDDSEPECDSTATLQNG